MTTWIVVIQVLGGFTFIGPFHSEASCAREVRAINNPAARCVPVEAAKTMGYKP